MSKVIFVAETDKARREEALETLDEIMGVIRDRAEKLLEVMNNDVLTCLSDTHRQLALDLGEADLDTEYELWGTIQGAPGGRWVTSQLDPAAVYPVGTALYVCKRKESTAESDHSETLNLDSFASSYPGEFKESLVELNKKPSTLWETMKLDDAWKARLEAAVLDEREACARICRDLGRGHGVAFAEFDCVEAIRARGKE
jgi:hypothetical protein